MKTPEQAIQLTDLRNITRKSDRVWTRVTVLGGKEIPWLLFGEARIRHFDDDKWQLAARLPVGVTDFEHDSGYAFGMGLIGLQYKGTQSGLTTVTAYVDPSNLEDFRVPLPGYNPMTEPEAKTCQTCPNHHIIVGESRWAGPPSNRQLFKVVAGRKLEILMGLVQIEE